MQSVQIEYYEASFLTNRVIDNREDLHKYVLSLYSSPINGERVLFSAAEHPSFGGKMMVVMRSNHPIESLPSTKVVRDISEGMECTLSIDISLNLSGRRRNADNKVPILAAENIGAWSQQAMEKRGFTPTVVNFTAPQRSHVPKQGQGRSFSIQSSTVVMRGVVANPELFAESLVKGVGRNKGYGYGLVELVQ